MDFILVSPLILAFLSTGQCNTEVTDLKCYSQCPRGYYKVDQNCHNSSAPYRCRKCDDGTYTAVENKIAKCMRCDICQHFEKEIRPCTFNSNVVCDCMDNYYNAGSEGEDRRDCMPCKPCSCQDNPDYKRKCPPCPRCFPSTTSSTPKRTSTTPSATTSLFMTVTASTTTSNPDITKVTESELMNQMPWMILAGVVGIFVMLLCLLLLFTRNPSNPFCFPCFSANKDLQLPVQDPRFSEQHSHQGSCPTTLTLNITEETPMMTLSPATSEHAAHIGPILPSAEHKATRQDEQLEQWPAMVLYAIIKEVPLRRWKEFLRLLSVADQQLERVELEAGLGYMERQYQMLKLWSQSSSASLSDVFSALHYMDLSGCAQLLQESLERLQWRPEVKKGAMQHT